LGICVTLACQALLPPLAVATCLLFLCMGMLGMGNGAVFQLVPQRFPKEIGIITGIVGAAGGAGGFFLPTALGSLKQWTGTFAGGFALFACASLICAALLQLVARSWEGVFVGKGGLASTPEPAAPVLASESPTSVPIEAPV
jgi:NNP family nitrate/nitrite transporter-like MFS transporter